MQIWTCEGEIKNCMGRIEEFMSCYAFGGNNYQEIEEVGGVVSGIFAWKWGLDGLKGMVLSYI